MGIISDNKPKARRCATCNTNWPFTTMYEQCPRGHGETFLAADEQPMNSNEADRIRRHWKEFAEYLVKREAEVRELEELFALS